LKFQLLYDCTKFLLPEPGLSRLLPMGGSEVRAKQSKGCLASSMNHYGFQSVVRAGWVVPANLPDSWADQDLISPDQTDQNSYKYAAKGRVPKMFN
jgi:hypothetical protein